MTRCLGVFLILKQKMNSLFEKLTLNLRVEVQSYLSPRYKLVDWVSEKREFLSIHELFQNPKALDYLSDYFGENHIPREYLRSILKNTSPQILDFVKEKKIDMGDFDNKEIYELCSNPFFVDIIEKKIKKIESEDCYYEDDETIIWHRFVTNPDARAIQLIKKDLEGCNFFSVLRWSCVCEDSDETGCACEEFKCWHSLCGNTNPDAIGIIENNIDKMDGLCWENLCSNPSAIPLLEKNLANLDMYGWGEMCSNPNAIPLLEKNLDKIDWTVLSGNPNAIPLLEKNPDKIDWNYLSGNKAAVHLIEDRLKKGGDEVNWSLLSENPSAISLLEKNRDKIDWKRFSRNPEIFVYDRKRITKDVLGM